MYSYYILKTQLDRIIWGPYSKKFAYRLKPSDLFLQIRILRIRIDFYLDAKDAPKGRSSIVASTYLYLFFYSSQDQHGVYFPMNSVLEITERTIRLSGPIIR